MAKTLRGIQCGDRKVLATSEAGDALQEFSEDCCGPQVCRVYGIFVPCGLPSPDPACELPPGKETLYVCVDVACAGDGRSWYFASQPEVPPRIRVIFYQGQCWRYTGTVLRENLPPGAQVIEDGTVDCVGDTCEDERCGTQEYAQATPCIPEYPPVWYCPAGLPFDCRVVALPQGCYEFSRDAATQPVPIGTPIVYFPPNGEYPVLTCCTCRCSPSNDPLPHVYCFGSSGGGYCCPDSGSFAAAPLLLDGEYVVRWPASATPPVTNYVERITFHAVTTAGAPVVTVNRRISWTNQDGTPFVQDDPPVNIPMPPVTCPVLMDFRTFGVIEPQIIEYLSCQEFRRFDRWQGNWTGRTPNGDPGDYNQLSLVWDLRVIAPEPPGCRNNNCGGSQAPVVGGVVTVAAGGCASCGGAAAQAEVGGAW